ncbi:MAG: cytochrome c biogenesis protein CcsA, partial [Armatimonadetes bacterium]|nr:cytochrome c biogenesis protein CcsA [Armatimonadota bacterium]
MLRHPAMVLHPPGIYVGFVALSVPYAFALAALITRRWEGWVELARPWALLAWVGLSVGLLLGMRWAYDVLGWGGYWGWDPVENAGLLPWLATTALLHAAAHQRGERRFLGWTLALAILDYGLVVFGVFAARSGMIASVHAYAVSPLGYYLLAALALIMLPGALMWLRRASAFREDDTAETLLFSSTGLTTLTLVLFLTLIASIMTGTLLPALTGMVLD